MNNKVKWLDKQCHSCGNQLNSWDVRISKALSYKNAVCETCAAKEYDLSATELREQLEDYFGMRPCIGI